MTNRRTNWSMLALATGLILLGILSRLFAHLPNFTPMFAIALFGGAVIPSRVGSLCLPLIALLISDAVLGFYSLAPVIYLCYLVMVLLGWNLRSRHHFFPVMGEAFTGSLFFFLVSNFAFWTGFGQPGVAGLMIAYTDAIPFFLKQLAGTMLYSTIFFGVYALGTKPFAINNQYIPSVPQS